MDTDGPLPTKTIDYRGGIVSFEVPAHWWERHFEDGGAEFWEEGQSWTLRLSVLSVAGEPGFYEGRDAWSILENSTPHDAPARLLRNGNALQEVQHREQERGTEIVIDQWILCRSVPDDHHRLAIFSFTTLASETDDAPVERERAAIRASVEQAFVSSELGVVP